MKNFKLKLFFVLFSFGFSSIYGQYTDVINSNKPGFSESPYSVGKGVYQFESSFFFRNTSINPTFSLPQSYGADLLFRTSFFLEKIEFNTQITYQRDKVAFKNIFTSHYFTSGISKMTVGAKYLLFQPEYTDKSKEVRSWKRRYAFDKKRFIPSVAIYVGMNTDFVNDIHKTGSITPKVGLLLQNNLTNEFNLITNFFYDKIGSDFSEFSYIITATQNFNDRWSAFFENQGVFQKQQNNGNIGLGLAYLFSKDLQINTSGRLLFEGKTQGFYAGLGISYRINKHKDSYIDLDDNGQEIKNTPITRYNNKEGSFLNRIFNVFKKKKRKRSRKRKSAKKKGKVKKGETEIEKLEREIKELEEEIKKDDNK
jgi:hypothetical protein